MRYVPCNPKDHANGCKVIRVGTLGALCQVNVLRSVSCKNVEEEAL